VKKMRLVSKLTVVLSPRSSVAERYDSFIQAVSV
jgi:hypothetical protein